MVRWVGSCEGVNSTLDLTMESLSQDYEFCAAHASREVENQGVVFVDPTRESGRWIRDAWITTPVLSPSQKDSKNLHTPIHCRHPTQSSGEAHTHNIGKQQNSQKIPSAHPLNSSSLFSHHTTFTLFHQAENKHTSYEDAKKDSPSHPKLSYSRPTPFTPGHQSENDDHSPSSTRQHSRQIPSERRHHKGLSSHFPLSNPSQGVHSR